MSKAKRVVRVLAEQLGVEESLIASCADVRAETGMDSLDEIEIVMALEDEFGFDIDDATAEKWVSAGDVIAFINANAPA